MKQEQPYTVMSVAQRMNNGETWDEIEKEIHVIGKKRAKEKGKCWWRCEVCDDETVLESTVRMCWPCCFWESETYNGNW